MSVNVAFKNAEIRISRPSISLNPPGKIGEDCLKLLFTINTNSQLIVEGVDLRTGKDLQQKNLGLVN